MYALFWDIDGTLITTMRAGTAAFDEACRLSLGTEAVDWSRIDFRGCSDYSIARRVLETHGKPADDAAVRRLLDAYESHLPSRLSERDGSALPGVVDVLERLRKRDDVLLLLLTGNTRGGARAKLGHYGLLDYFAGPAPGNDAPFGAFAEAGSLREAIARAALVVAETAAGAPLRPERCFVIGDTPHDVSCGKAIGARTVAVASGGYGLDELRACEPWLLWERLPEPEAFEQALGLSPISAR
jgi:phosphoglycolate phosphatase-like HAD superfamily hydrolase